MPFNLAKALSIHKGWGVNVPALRAIIEKEWLMDIQEMLREIRELRSEVHNLRVELTRYKGFAGGVMWCVSGTTALLGFVWGMLIEMGR
jgi:hypothetical protein